MSPKNIDVIKDLYEHDLVEVTGLVSKRFDKVSVIVNNISKGGLKMNFWRSK